MVKEKPKKERLHKSWFSVIGSFPTIRFGDINYSSTVERDFLFFVDYFIQIEKFIWQPFAIKSTAYKNEPHVYHPDAQLLFKKFRPALVEIKREIDLSKEETQQQITIGTVWSEENDHDFILALDTDMRQGHKLKNIKVFWRYARLGIPQPLEYRIMNFMASKINGATLGEVKNYLSGSSSENSALPYIYAMLFHHTLETKITDPLSNDSPIWLPKDNCDEGDELWQG
jgi:hypothetical protein